jgi:hypothetical protein
LRRARLCHDRRVVASFQIVLRVSGRFHYLVMSFSTRALA